MSLLHDRVAELLGANVTHEERLAGGDIAGAILLTLSSGKRIVAKRGPTAAIEADMLRSIAATGAPAPEVIAVRKNLLLMEFVPNDGGLSWSSLGAMLELLHAPVAEAYGWPQDYVFGRVGVPNGRSRDWPRFWAENRLLVHCRHVEHGLAFRLDRLANRLGEMLPSDPAPSLLHSDLWGGNILGNAGQVVGLIDPACYYGDREVDFAMLTLFDNPPNSFFEAAGLEPGWRERLDAYRLWPLLVHLRLFGASYMPHVTGCLDRLGV